MDASIAVGLLQLQHTKQQHEHDKTGDVEMKQTHNDLLVSINATAYVCHMT